jgi:voltage-gated potassium channel
MWFFTFYRRRRTRRRHRRDLGPRVSILQRSGMAVGYIALIVLGHALAMVQFENMSFGDGIWLTITSLTTVGYGDLSAKSWEGRTATALIIYLGGIFVAGKFAGDFFEYRSARRAAMKLGDWNYSNLMEHIVVLGSERDYEFYFKRLVDELQQDTRTEDRNIVLVSRAFPDGLPVSLSNAGAKLVSGNISDPEVLTRAGIGSCHIALVLAWRENDAESDGRTFDVVHRIREENSDCTVVAECVDDENRKRLLRAGASIVIRPMRSYPEMAVAAFLQPGSSEILENLFTGAGEQIICHENAENDTWEAIVSKYLALGNGIPIAYRNSADSGIVTAPNAKAKVCASAIYVLSGSSSI